MKHYRIHYNPIGAPYCGSDFSIDVPEGSTLKVKMEDYFTRNWDEEPNAVLDLDTHEWVNKSLWGFMVDKSRSIFDSHDSYDDMGGEREFMRSEASHRSLTEDERIIYGL